MDGTSIARKLFFNREYWCKICTLDCACDTNGILSYLNKQNIKPVITLKRNRLYQRDYERPLYCFRHIIENTFLALKC